MTRRRPHFLFLLLAVLVPAATAYAQVDKIRVGAWNIEHLGSPGSRFGDADGIAQKPEDLAAHIKKAGVHVLALEEIGDTADPGMRSKELDATFAILNADGEDWVYELTPNKLRTDKTQVTGVAWNRKLVKKVGTVHRFAVTPNPPSSVNHWDRHPSAFKFSAGEGKTDFVVVTLHMKAGMDEAEIKQRKEEMELLMKEVPAFKTKYKEEDLILLGDVNVRTKNEAALKICTDAGFKDLNADALTTVPWGEAPFDHIFLTNQSEFAGASMTRMVTNNEEDRRKLSDHFLVYTEILVKADDDENPEFGNGGIPIEPSTGEQPVESTPTSSAVKIMAVLPDPVGPDEDNEAVTLSNGGVTEVALQGWTLKDKADNVFNLSGSVAAGSTRSIKVRGNFTLNQAGDEVRLIDPTGKVVHKGTYTAAQVKQGKFIVFAE